MHDCLRLRMAVHSQNTSTSCLGPAVARTAHQENGAPAEDGLAGLKPAGGEAYCHFDDTTQCCCPYNRHWRLAVGGCPGRCQHTLDCQM